MTTTATDRALRIGEVAELTGTTPRTIRYYEEIGLLGGRAGIDREQGKHRVYSAADVDRIKEIVRLKELLGLTLDQLSKLLEAESARAELRREWQQTEDRDERVRILTESLHHIGTQLELVRSRRAELDKLERELAERQESVGRKLSEIQAG
jgi:MerR family transcriptional regulator, repressor of the yfmOP operon